ncbi:hypothetical protein VARIO8X_110135 [Burkholderiales bacterium 8X]|nr:hypothetical protein VARIO8X_110135 [Burkholderiales bacterium 8X]
MWAHRSTGLSSRTLNLCRTSTLGRFLQLRTTRACVPSRQAVEFPNQQVHTIKVAKRFRKLFFGSPTHRQ